MALRILVCLVVVLMISNLVLGVKVGEKIRREGRSQAVQFLLGHFPCFNFEFCGYIEGKMLATCWVMYV